MRETNLDFDRSKFCSLSRVADPSSFGYFWVAHLSGFARVGLPFASLSVSTFNCRLLTSHIALILAFLPLTVSKPFESSTL